MKNYDVIIIGAGPGGIYSAYELSSLRPKLKIAVFESGQPLENGTARSTEKRSQNASTVPSVPL